MNKDKVRQAFKSGTGADIANAMKEYYKEKFRSGEVKPLQFYKQGELQEENKIRQNSEMDIVDKAMEIFSV